ncbi:MAG: Bax inhibitor-1/YccA family protein [Bacteroidaceae bacterium]|nr:Bax inhibitor-1/YccA family protein [Bacteroidaceae bacterium]
MNNNDYIEIQDSYDRGAYVSSTAGSVATAFSGIMSRVYLWMSAALLLTAGTAYVTASSPALLQLIFGNSIAVWGLFILELGLVMGVTAGINRLSPTAATALFLLYSVVNGLTLSVIFFAYELGTIYQAFAASALTFGAMSLVGYTTKRDLSGLGGILIMGLIGLIIASVVNIFWGNSVMDAIITYIGVFIFVGLTAYDTQQIKNLAAAVETGSQMGYTDAAAPRRIAIIGALTLYLDFINLFLYLLRLFGRSRD